MALLSLCIKPLSPFASPGRPRPLLIFHDFIPAISSRLQPFFGPVVADRGVSLARSLAREHFRQDVSQNLYRPPGAGQRGEERKGIGMADGGEGAMVAEARVVFEKGEPRHISLQTNNF